MRALHPKLHSLGWKEIVTLHYCLTTISMKTNCSHYKGINIERDDSKQCVRLVPYLWSLNQMELGRHCGKPGTWGTSVVFSFSHHHCNILRNLVHTKSFEWTNVFNRPFFLKFYWWYTWMVSISYTETLPFGDIWNVSDFSSTDHEHYYFYSVILPFSFKDVLVIVAVLTVMARHIVEQFWKPARDEHTFSPAILTICSLIGKLISSQIHHAKL